MSNKHSKNYTNAYIKGWAIVICLSIIVCVPLYGVEYAYWEIDEKLGVVLFFMWWMYSSVIIIYSITIFNKLAEESLR